MVNPTQPSTFAIRTSQRKNQKLQKSLSVLHRFFADPKSKIGLVVNLKV
jgi:hypothetical protein